MLLLEKTQSILDIYYKCEKALSLPGNTEGMQSQISHIKTFCWQGFQLTWMYLRLTSR